MKKQKEEKKKKYIVAGYPPWSRDIFKKMISKYPGTWHLFSKPEELSEERLNKINPKFIFFLHWSQKVPENIIKNYECVCFHMTDVPYGRGGSPLQNLIIRGHKKTKLTALRMVEEFDAGPVYLKRSMLLRGSAQEIYKKASKLAAKMILEIIRHQIIPYPQKGKIVIFKRRKPEQSEVPGYQDIGGFFDFIRMLDAPGYPKAFVKYKGFVLEFSKAKMSGPKILSNVEIKKYEENK